MDPAGSASITHNEVRYEDNYDEIHLVVSYSFGTLLANDDKWKAGNGCSTSSSSGGTR